eukprot:CAMPEP_0177539118 /NCGR_PEP_ID=MMETSP0369-20130122/58782_1 /TAXON_ID=447022 ORGANISM="Scrippsiella hangoei-like, Strain SHHI-4" /NCGR_SAMPLE_ID=MMETSP0369 /ASSEMBLY_ACC=CAM_ASM_000364 /LENGTH=59 /DNA_ID=CAMNT_0019022059 /DNA_START=145 /DNA_END=325 /DNA_ORIENTATION=+
MGAWVYQVQACNVRLVTSAMLDKLQQEDVLAPHGSRLPTEHKHRTFDASHPSTGPPAWG